MQGAVRSVALFCATLVSVWYTYGVMWAGGDPLRDPEVRAESAVFALALMGILLAHEMAHYVVARRHGFELSLPDFIPVPFVAFGTFGAIIRLRSMPTSRTALLEMGAAGPLAGALLAFVCIGLGLGEIGPAVCHEVADPPAAVETVYRSLDALLAPLAACLPAMEVPEGHLPVSILGDPPVMKLLGEIILGQAPGRFDELGPLTLAGWVGCLLTAINLVPIGQLDGGHILNALMPRHALLLSKVLLGLVLAAGLLWPGWFVWGVLVFWIGAWRSLPVPEGEALTLRARVTVVLVIIAFALTFMPSPITMDTMPDPCVEQD